MFASALNSLWVERETTVYDDVSYLIIIFTSLPVTAALVMSTYVVIKKRIWEDFTGEKVPKAAAAHNFELVSKAAMRIAALNTDVGVNLFWSASEWDRWYLMQFAKVVPSVFLAQPQKNRLVSQLDIMQAYADGGITTSVEELAEGKTDDVKDGSHSQGPGSSGQWVEDEPPPPPPPDMVKVSNGSGAGVSVTTQTLHPEDDLYPVPLEPPTCTLLSPRSPIGTPRESPRSPRWGDSPGPSTPGTPLASPRYSY